MHFFIITLPIFPFYTLTQSQSSTTLTTNFALLSSGSTTLTAYYTQKYTNKHTHTNKLPGLCQYTTSRRFSAFEIHHCFYPETITLSHLKYLSLSCLNHHFTTNSTSRFVICFSLGSLTLGFH